MKAFFFFAWLLTLSSISTLTQAQVDGTADVSEIHQQNIFQQPNVEA